MGVLLDRAEVFVSRFQLRLPLLRSSAWCPRTVTHPARATARCSRAQLPPTPRPAAPAHTAHPARLLLCSPPNFSLVGDGSRTVALHVSRTSQSLGTSVCSPVPLCLSPLCPGG